MSASVHLGFLSPAEDLQANINDFPSKVGGRPIWLNPNPMPAENVVCGVCGKPQVLLLQIYTPEDDPPEAYHRVVYVFCCKNGKCHKVEWKKSMSVFRSQLPRDNPYYPPPRDDADEDAMDTDGTPAAALPDLPAYRTCAVCGLAGTKSCGACRAAHYCGRDHQAVHWSQGRHKQLCGVAQPAEEEKERDARFLRSCLFPEHELISEDEPDTDAGAADAELAQSEDLVKLAEDMDGWPAEEEAEDSEVGVDKAFLKFQKRISREPEQVLRYTRVSYDSDAQDPQPLWASEQDRPDPDTDIGPCPSCGARRTFELQVMPQLLNSLGIVHADPDALDWGTLLVYSCEANCTPREGFYHRETIWRQMFADQGIQLRAPGRE
ncbi:programmed cell death protein 2 [Hyaloraphidium curvatum]|nr:programmed cell death protein 2 [Hyaloraphidium curvatum]